MPIIIWGSRGLTRQLDRGDFHCPGCDQQSTYALMQVREWFTLYWIPIFPVSGATRYVECRGCGGAYQEEVLTMGPPSEAEQTYAQVYRELEEGMSLEEGEDRLTEAGLPPDQAHVAIAEMGRDDNWRCKGCGRHYLGVVRSCRRC